MPRSLDFHPKLPRTDTGKLYKRHLADEYKDKAREGSGKDA
jgi:fatty-acyl-CoA synthase